MLLYSMGEDTDDTFTSTDITTVERKQYRSVIAKHDENFHLQRNVIFKQARLNHCIQKVSTGFITNLYNYGDLKNDMIRDRVTYQDSGRRSV